jgi:plasmid stabilization system protein ParE
MTGGVSFTPEAEQQLNEIDDWITTAASVDVARRFVSALLDHIAGIPTFPFAVGLVRTSGRACGPVPTGSGPSSPTRSMRG